MVPANLEYILFGVGIFVILLSLYLSYRLEKGKKDESTVSNELLKKELIKLREKMDERDLARKIEDLFQLIEHKVRTQNSKNDDLKREIKLIKNTVENSANREIELEEKLNNLMAEIEKIKEDYSDLKGELEGRFSEQLDEIENMQEELKLLLENDDILQTEISEIKEEIIVKEEEELPAAGAQGQGPDGEGKFEEDFEPGEDEKHDIQKEVEKHEEITEAEILTQQPEDNKLSGEMAAEKRKKFETIKELKEAGMDISEIADRVNMGVREVELFWKVNAPRG